MYTSSSWQRYLLLYLTLLTCSGAAQTFVTDGLNQYIQGFDGTTFKTIAWKPMCGNLGWGKEWKDPKHFGDKCNSSVNAFRDTYHLTAVYDVNGNIQKGVQISNGNEACLCMALRQMLNTGLRGALCIWVDGAGQPEIISWTNANGVTESAYTGNYEPGLNRSLLTPDLVNMDELRASVTGSSPPYIPTSVGSSDGGVIQAAYDVTPPPGAVEEAPQPETSPSGTLISGVTSAIGSIIVICLFLCWCFTPYKVKEVWSGPAGTTTVYR